MVLSNIYNIFNKAGIFVNISGKNIKSKVNNTWLNDKKNYN